MRNQGNPALAREAGGSWLERLLWSQRRKLFDAFMQFRHGSVDDNVLDVCRRGPDHGGTFGGWDGSTKSLVTTCAIDPAHPGARLPYADASFDWVYCGEVIEYAGTPERRQALVSECYRVARKGVFITTPNRRHPLDFEGGLPFLHWLPGKAPTRGGRRLLDAPELYALAADLPGAPAHDVGHKRVFGIKAHFFLMIAKPVIV